MKKTPTYLPVLLFLYLLSSVQLSQAKTERFYREPTVNIPDANFKAYLIGNSQINTNGDAEIQVAEAEAFTGTIDCTYKNIADLTGVEAFINLTSLQCFGNRLTNLDVSKNTSLTDLKIFENELTSLDVSKNINLTELHVSYNQLTSLDVSKNISLTNLSAESNQLVNLDLSKNVSLTSLYVSYNQLTSLDLSQNINLAYLHLSNNKLTELDLSNHTALEELDLRNNDMISLNLKSGKNNLLYFLRLQNNTYLSCIQVDNPATANTKFNWEKDATASYNTVCTFPIVNIPDRNFKYYLVNNAAINTNGDNEIQLSEAVVFTGTIDCREMRIVDLTGIEAFVRLETLDCAFNKIASLDVSKNTALINLYANGNLLTSLDVSENTALKQLYLAENQLFSLDVSKNTDLEQLVVNNNDLVFLDVSKNISLKQLSATSNQLSSLNLTENIVLERLNVQDNKLVTLNLANGNNINLEYLYVVNNPSLNCIKVDDVAMANAKATNNWQKDATASYNTACTDPVVAIPDATFKAYLVGNSAINTNGDAEIQLSEAEAFKADITCDGKNISDLTGIEAFVNLTELSCSNNNITSLIVSRNRALKYLFTNNNQLTSIDVTKNSALLMLSVAGNQLASLNVNNNSALEDLYVSNNQLTALIVGKNTALATLSVSGNQLISLDVSKNKILGHLNASSNQLISLNINNGFNASMNYGMNAQNNPNLSCIQVDNVATAGSKYNWQKDVTASYNTVCTALFVNIPDVDFKAYLVGNSAINTNGDSEIQFAEAEAFTGGISYGKNNADLTGLEAFINLTSLYCIGINLKTLDISKNTALVELYAEQNSLTSLDLSHNTALKYLSISYNLLTDLDVSKNTALEELNIHTNMLTSLDVSKNLALINLNVSENRLTNLIISENTLLDELSVSGNQLIGLDVSKNIALTDLDISRNQLIGLDVNKNIALTDLYISYNQLESLDISKNVALKYLYCNGNKLVILKLNNGNNTGLLRMYAQENPNLSCIQVDDVALANGKNTNNWQKGATASYSVNCNYALPVSLVSYTAKIAADYALLQWKTDTEFNNYGFAVYRSGDDKQFIKIGFTATNGSATGGIYNFTDKQPLNGNNYYKLVQLDNDGTSTEFGVKSLSFNFNVNNGAKVFPNPVEQQINFSLGSFAGKAFKASLYDITGKLVVSRDYKINDTDKYTLDIAKPTAGIYFLQLNANGYRQKVKVLVK